MQTTDELYDQIISCIRSRFDKTVRNYKLLQANVGIKICDVSVEEHKAYGYSLKAAGHFEMDTFFDDGIYSARWHNPKGDRGTVYIIADSNAYDLSAGQAHTIKMISQAAFYGEEDLIADIMLAAACNEITYTYEELEQMPTPIQLSDKARSILEERGYKWWHYSSRQYVFYLWDGLKFEDLPILKLKRCLMADSYDIEKITDIIFELFKTMRQSISTVVHKSMILQKYFFYESMACTYLMDIKKSYEDGNLSKEDLKRQICEFKEKKYAQCKAKWKIEDLNMKALERAIDQRIETVLVELQNI